MPAGRPRKPAQQKLLEGSALREDRDAPIIAAPLTLPPCPVWLPKAAKKHWDTLGPQLLAIGLITAVDGDVFAIHCDNVARLAEVQAKLVDLKDWIDTTPNGYQVQSAMLQIRNNLQDRIIKTAREFGLTPSGRSGLRVEPQKQQGLFGDLNEFNDFRPAAPRVS